MQAGIVAFTRTVSASPSSVGDAGHGFCASCLRVLRKVFTLVWSGIENGKPAFSRSLESVSTVDAGSQGALHCKQEGDVQVTEKVGFSNRDPECPGPALPRGREEASPMCISLEVDFSVPGIYIRTG